METLVTVVLGFNVPPQLIGASVLSRSRPCRLSSHLWFYRKWFTRKREADSSVVDFWNSDRFGEGIARKLPERPDDRRN
jgi:hypothetical protein